MTTFYAEVRIFTHPKHETDSLSIEIPAPDIGQALSILMAWKAGLSAHFRFDTAMEESLSAKPTRGRTYLTLREASLHIRDHVFG